MSVPSSTAEVRPDGLPLFQPQTVRQDTAVSFFTVAPVPPGDHLPTLSTFENISPVVTGHHLPIIPFHSRASSAANASTNTSGPNIPPPDIIAFTGRPQDRSSNIDMFTNPHRDSVVPAAWSSVTIAQLEQPSSIDQAVIRDNSGMIDVIVSSGTAKDGIISWLENPSTPTGSWKVHTIATSLAPCYVKAGRFSQRDTLQIMAVPIAATPVASESPLPFSVFTKPDDPTQNWSSDPPVPTTATPRDAFVIPSSNAGTSAPFDQIILASHRGIDVRWYDETSWQTFHVGSVLNPQPSVGSVSVGRVHGDYAGYICSVENLSGDLVCAYFKDPGSGHGIVGQDWTRKVLDDFSPTSGSVCQVVCADIDDDGVDEILVAVIGSDPSDTQASGVWAYKLVDQKEGTFIKTRLSSTPTSYIAPTNLRPTGSSTSGMDFVASGPLVPGGQTSAANRSLCAYLSTGIVVQRLENEVLFKVIRPQYAKVPTVMPFLCVNGYRFSIAVLPPGMSMPSKFKADGVKVLTGSYAVDQEENAPLVKTRATRPMQTESLLVGRPTGINTSGGMGCTFFVIEKPPDTCTVSKPTSKNIFPPDAPADVRALRFPWVPVKNNPAKSKFLHIAGFHVHEASDNFTRICRIEFFATSEGVVSGFVNHRDESASHIRASIVNSTGAAGMRFATVADEDFDPNNPDLDKTKLVPMDAFTEHGALWRMTRDGLPRLRSNATIDYPWNSWVAGAPINDSSLPARDNSSPVGDGSHPAFDIFATFSFPPFMTFGRPQADIPDGTYIIRFVPPGGSTGRNNFLALESQGPNPAVDPLAITIHSPKDQWRIFRVPGTDMYAIRHVVTSRLLGSKWPVKVNQNMIGARTPDQLGFTTRFAAIRDPQGNVNFRITSQSDLEEDLFLASSLTTDASTSRIPVVLQFKGFDTPAWSLESV